MADVYIAWERFGAFRDAFKNEGHNVFSATDAWAGDDLADTQMVDDPLDFMGDGWDLVMAFPPCTYLSLAGWRYIYNGGAKGNGFNRDRIRKVQAAIGVVNDCITCKSDRVAVEQPGHPKWVQRRIVLPVAFDTQPFNFGIPVRKRTTWRTRGVPDIELPYTGEGMHIKRFPQRHDVIAVRAGEKSADDFIMPPEGETNFKGPQLARYSGGRPEVAEVFAAQWGPLLGTPVPPPAPPREPSLF